MNQRANLNSGSLAKSKIARKLVLWAVIAGLVASVIASSFQFYINFQYRYEHVDTNIEKVGNTFLPSLSQSVWAFDLPQVKLQMQTIIQQPYVSSAELLLEDGSAPEFHGRIIRSEHFIEKQFPLVHTNNRQETTELGILILRKDFDEEREQLLVDGFYSFISNTLIIVVIAFSIIQIFQVAVTRRLTSMAAEWGRISEADLRDRDHAKQLHPHVVRSGKEPDELDVLEQAIELLFRTGSRALQDAEEKEKILIELKKKADAASTAKSEFLANMSHEIRTPMNGVTGIAELLLKTRLSPNQEVLVRQLSSSAEGLLQIINDILDFSKIEADQLQISLHEVDIDELVNEVAFSFSAIAQQKGIELICPASPPLNLHVQADDVRIRQVLVNLIGNALKFTDQGEVSVRCDCLSVDDNKAQIRFSVRDTGMGIPAEQQEKLFDRFTQADNSGTRAYGGTGLGLAICKKLVELMEGEIGLNSSPEGSEFWFSMTLDVEAEKTPMELPKPVKVMLVGGSSTQNQYLSASLQISGAEAAALGNPERLVAELLAARDQLKPFTQVWFDSGLGEAAVTNQARKIKANPGLAGVSCVLITADLLFDTDSCPEFDQVLTKPAQHRGVNALLLQENTQLKEDEEQQDTPELSAVKVLVVEDNPTNQMVAEGMLRQLGVAYETAQNGLEAVEMLAQEQFDLVFMDCQMPLMDGYQATQEIRKGQGVLDKNIPIVAMTANALIGDREKCLSVGMDDYIAKPVSLDKLTIALHKWCGTGSLDSSGVDSVTSDKVRAAESIDADQLFNYPQMHDLLMGDDALVKTVLETFLADIPDVIQLLKEDAARGSCTDVAGKAHKIKGAADNVAAATLRATALALELAGKEDNLTEVERLIPQLDNCFNELHSVLQMKLEEISA